MNSVSLRSSERLLVRREKIRVDSVLFCLHLHSPTRYNLRIKIWGRAWGLFLFGTG